MYEQSNCINQNYKVLVLENIGIESLNFRDGGRYENQRRTKDLLLSYFYQFKKGWHQGKCKEDLQMMTLQLHQQQNL